MTNHNNISQFLTGAEALLVDHADDSLLHGAARPRAQRKIARIAYGALTESCELIRELMTEISTLRAGGTEIMPCGHPRACLVSADAEHDSTVSCSWCADKARWEGLLAVAAENAEGFRELFIKSERKMVALEAEVRLARMRATVGGGSVL